MQKNYNLEKMAFYDHLTKLKNLNSLYKDCEDKTLDNTHFIYVDLEGFKKINEVFGYDAGNDILVEVSQKLVDYCGKSEVYRIGGDEFILLTDSHIKCEPSELAKIFESPIKLDDMQFMIKGKISVLDHDDFPKNDLKDVLKFLDFSITDAKKNNLGNLIYATSDLKDKYNEKREIEKHFFTAIQEDEFYPKFTPFVDTFTDELVGFETVSRWNFFGKTLRPNMFLPIAMFTGLIYDIECKMFRETVKFISEIKNNKNWKHAKGFKGAVNFTCQTLNRLDIRDLIKVLKEYDVSPSEVIIEMSEKSISNDCAVERFNELRKAGFYIILDEFTTENSSICFLADSGVNAIKLDESLLMKMDEAQEFKRMHSVYKFMTELAQKIDVRVIADGILNKKHIKVVKELGINIGIGHYYSRPIVKDEFIEKFFEKKGK